jgi:hypothetical protein
MSFHPARTPTMRLVFMVEECGHLFSAVLRPRHSCPQCDPDGRDDGGTWTWVQLYRER